VSFAGVIILLCWVATLIAVALGLLARPRGGGLRAILCVMAVVVALGSAIAAWYAWAESRSVVWALGYGLLSLLAVASALRQAFGSPRSAPTP